MTNLHYGRQGTNPYYPNSNPYVNQSYHMPRNSFENDQQAAADALLEGMKREAKAVQLYTQLANAAPNQEHRDNLLYALEGKKAYLSQFTNLYTNLTGSHPVYDVEPVSVNSYQEGLQKAYELEIEGLNEYHRSCMVPQHPDVQQTLLWALNGEQENAARLDSLRYDIEHRAEDYGGQPFVVDIEEATKENTNFRTALWTGEHFQLTLMSIDVGDDIGLETHPNLDQFLRIEEGQGIVQMGDSPENLYLQQEVEDDYAIFVPAGYYHNLINTGDEPLKLYSIYAPPEHPFGTVHETKEDALAAEEEHNHY
ncbi:cupin [Alkalihalophilus pseudofirmus]|nr:cupin [Alkalihalophilus pseudofirmus]